jgi:hypothetical protein
MAELKQVLTQLDSMKESGASAQEAANFIKQQGMDVKAVSNLYGTYRQTGEMPEESGLGTAVLQGLTFGFSEEIGGVVSELTGGDYDAYVANERAKYKIYKDANPLLAMGGEILGSLPTMFVPGGAVLKGTAAATRAARGGQAAQAAQAVRAAQAAKTAPGMLSTTMRGAGQAAAEGALYGFGTGEGGVQQRLMSAGSEGLLSGVAGGVTAPLSRLYSMGRATKGMDQQQQAITELARRIEEPTQARMAAELADAGDQAGLTLADVGGRETQRMLRGLRTVSPDAQEYLDNFLGERFRNQYDRITGMVNEAFQANPELAGAVTKNLEEQSDLARSAYTEAFHKHSAIANPDLNRLISTDDEFKKAYDATREAMIRSVRNAKDDVGITKRQTLMATPKAADITDDSKLSLQVLHNMKVDMDKQRRGAPGVGAEYFYKQNLKAMSDDLVTAMDSATDGDYGKLVSNFAEASQLQEALDLGRNFKKLNASELRQELQSMSSNEAEMYMAGVLDTLYQRIKEVGYNQDTVTALMKSPELEDRLKAIFPNEAAWNRFRAQMANEAKMQQTNRLVTGGSNTADKLQDVEAEGTLFKEALDIMTDPSGITQGTAVMRAIKNFAIGLNTRLQTKSSTRGLQAQLLAESDPTKRAEIMQKISRARKRLLSQEAVSDVAGVRAARVTGAAVARMGDNE